MANPKYLNTIIVLKNDSTAEWNAHPESTLLKGETAIEIIDGGKKVKMKVGTEDNQYFKDAPYLGGDENEVHKVATLDELKTKSAVKGDIGIVSADDVYYTAYVFDGTNWAAMSGNYDATNVYLTEGFTLAGNFDKVGNYNKGKTIDAGTSLQSLLTDMFSQRLQPAIVKDPSASITLYIDGATKKTTAGSVEVGTTIYPSYTASLEDGEYTYNKTTGVTATSYTVSSSGRKTVYGANETTIEDSANTSNGTFDSFVVDDDTSYKLNVSINHSAGDIAKDNLNSNSNPTVQIPSGTKTKTSGTVSGYRAWFCGYKNGTNALADASAITGAQVRALGNAANGSWQSSMSVAQMKQMFFAAPAGKGYKPVIKDSATTAPQTVKGPITVSVEGANGFDAIDYDVWYVSNADAASGTATLNITKV